MRRWVVIAILVAALIPSALIALYSRDMPHLGAAHDDAIYWVSAKSLAQGAGYRILSLPGEPFQTKYPPLYPLALSLIWRAVPRFPGNLPLAMAFCWAFLPVFLALVWKLLPRLGLSPRQGVVACVLLALNPFVVLYSVSLMSELPFCCLLFGCLLLAMRAGNRQSPWWLAAAAGALGAVAFLTRNSALPLLVSVPLWLLWRRRFAAAALFFTVMSPSVAGWSLWVRAHPASGADPLLLYYTDYTRYHFANFAIGETPFVVWKNALEYFPGIGSIFLLPQGAGMFEGSVFPFLAAAAILAVIRFAKRNGAGPYHLFAAFYLAMLLPWQLGNHERVQRLLFPLFPLLFASVVAEFAEVWRWLAQRFRTGSGLSSGIAPLGLATLGFAALLCGLTWISMVCHFPGFIQANRVQLAGARPDYDWIASNIPPGRALLTDTDPLVYLHTGRRACGLIVPPRLLYLGSPQDIARFMDSAPQVARGQGLSYMAVRKSEGRYVMSGEFVNPPRDLRLVYDSPRTSIYAIE